MKVRPCMLVLGVVLAPIPSQAATEEPTVDQCLTPESAQAVLAHDKQDLQQIKAKIEAEDAAWNHRVEIVKRKLVVKGEAVKQRAAQITGAHTSAYMKEAMALLQKQFGSMGAQAQAAKRGDTSEACRQALKTQAAFREATAVHQRFYEGLLGDLNRLLASGS